MRVLHITSGNLFGGVETFLAELARNRNVSSEMEPEYALCFEGRISNELTETGVPVHLLGNIRVRNPLSVWSARRRLAELLRNKKFDIAICHMPWIQAIFGPVVSAANIPLVVWFHNAANRWHWVDIWARVSTVPDQIICNSAFTAATLPKNLAKVPTTIVYYPVRPPHLAHDNNRRQILRAALQTEPDAIVIIQISRMEEWKGHLLHLQALSRLKDIPKWVCWQVGGPQRTEEEAYFESLKVEAERLGINDRLRFLGERNDVAELLSAADLFCQPNLIPEPFGLVFIEALLANLPIVAVASGGALEIINDSCGFLVPPDAESIANMERELIQDNSLRLHLGNAGPKRAQDLCDVETQINKLAAILLSVLQTWKKSHFQRDT